MGYVFYDDTYLRLQPACSYSSAGVLFTGTPLVNYDQSLRYTVVKLESRSPLTQMCYTIMCQVFKNSSFTRKLRKRFVPLASRKTAGRRRAFRRRRFAVYRPETQYVGYENKKNIKPTKKLEKNFKKNKKIFSNADLLDFKKKEKEKKNKINESRFFKYHPESILDTKLTHEFSLNQQSQDLVDGLKEVVTKATSLLSSGEVPTIARVEIDTGFRNMVSQWFHKLSSNYKENKVLIGLVSAGILCLYYASRSPVVLTLINVLTIALSALDVPMGDKIFFGLLTATLDADWFLRGERHVYHPEADFSSKDLFMGGLLSFIFSDSIRNGVDMESILKGFKSVGSVQRGAEFTFDYILKTVKELALYIHDMGYLPGVLIQPCLSDVQFRVAELTRSFRAGREFDYDAAMELYPLERDIRDALIKLPVHASSNAERSVLEGMLKSLSPFIDKLERNNIFNSGPRDEPLGALIGGASGVGKSTMIMPLMMYCGARTISKEKFESFTKNHNDHVWNYIAENQYADGYHGQFMTYLDDVGQQLDTPGNPDNASIGAIRMLNHAPYPLVMAHLFDKGRTDYRSEWVWATTNRTYFDFKSLYCNEAFTRRFKISYLSVPKPEYSTDETSKGGLWERRLDMKKLPPSEETYGFYLGANQYYPYDFLHGKVIGAPISFEELGDLCVKMFKENRDKNKRFKDLLIKLKDDGITKRTYKPEAGVFEYLRKKVGWVLPSTPLPTVHDMRLQDLRNFVRSLLIHIDDIRGNSSPDLWLNNLNTLLDQLGVIQRRSTREVFEERFKDSLSYTFLESTESKVDSVIADLEKDAHSYVVEVERFCPMVSPKETASEEDIMFFLLDINEFRRRSLSDSARAFSDVLSSLGSYSSKIGEIIKQHPVVTTIIATCGAAVLLYKMVLSHFNVQAADYDPLVKAHQRARQKRSKRIGKHMVTVNQSTGNWRFEVESGTFNNNDIQLALRVLTKNVYTIHHENSPKRLGFITFIRDRLAMMPAHFYDALLKLDPDGNGTITVKRVRAEGSGVSCKLGDLEFFHPPDQDQDLTFAQFPVVIHRHSDISDLFGHKEVSDRQEVLVVCPVGKDPILQSCSSNRVDNLNYGDYTSDVALTTIGRSSPGDCGSLTFGYQNGTRRFGILGFHVAGASVSRVTKVIGAEEIPNEGDKLVHEEDPLQVQASVCFGPNMNVLGKRPERMSVPTRTAYIRSPLYGDWGGEGNFRPALLHPLKSRETGEILDPMALARKKYSNVFRPFDISLLREVTELYATVACAGTDETPRVMSFEEAVEGIHGDPCFNPIPRSTSLGFPDSLHTAMKGKTELFGVDGPYTFDTPKALELKEKVEEFEDSIRRMVRPYFIFTDFLKDELRPLEKVLSASSRMVSGSPIPYTILCRKYFGHFSRNYLRGRIYNGSTLGVNVFGCDWGLIRAFLTRKSDQILDGDFRAYDGSIPPVLLYMCLVIFDLYYGHEDTLMRSILFEDLVNSRHIDVSTSTVMEWIGSVASGHFLTALIDTMVNNILVRYAVCAVLISRGYDRGSVVHFVHNNLDMVANGDDNLLALTQLLREAAPLESFVDMMDSLGFKYTSSDKSDKIRYKSILEVQYLKRGFVDGGDCPLSMDTILRMPYWYKKKDDFKILISIVSESLQELSLHGKEVWSAHGPKMIDACQRRLGLLPPFTSYDTCYKAIKARADLFEVQSSCSMPAERGGLFSLTYQGAPGNPRNLDRASSHGLSRPCEYENRLATSTTQGLGDQKTPIESTISVATIDSQAGVDLKSTTVTASENTQHATTVFVDDALQVKNDMSYIVRHDDGIEQNFDDIKAFLRKPYLLTTTTFSTAGVENDNLISGNVKSALNIGIWANKIEGFNLFRGTFNLILVHNANPFQQGRLLMHYLPCQSDHGPYYTKMHNSSLVSKSQHPNVEVDCRTTSGELAIPYVTPYDFFDRKDDRYDWGTYYVDILSRLRTGSSGETSIIVNLYGYWTDVELAAPLAPQSSTVPQRKYIRKSRIGEGETQLLTSKPISTALSLTSKAASSLSAIPLLASVMEPASWALNAAAGLASYFGYSKPNLESAPLAVQNAYNRYMASSTGIDSCVPLSLIAENKLEVTDQISFTKQDEMSFNYLKKVPAYGGKFSWSTTDTSGTQIAALPVSPMYTGTAFVDTVGPHSATYGVGPPIWYLAQMFALWRGTIIIHMKIPKTEFHSGRLEVTFTPGNTTTVPSNTSLSAFSLREIVDLREGDEFRFALPYMIGKRFLDTYGSSIGKSRSGYFSIRVLTQLRCPETCSSTIEPFIYYSGGDDFELSVPGGTQTYNNVPYVPQAGLVTNSGIGGTDIKKFDVTHSALTIGESFSSVRQLILRHNRVRNFDPWPTTSNSKVLWPFFVGACTLTAGTGVVTEGTLGGDALSNIMLGYAMYRGSVKIQIMPGTDSDNPPNSFNTIATVVPSMYYSAVATPLSVIDNQPADIVTGSNVNAVSALTPYLTPSLGMMISDLGVGSSGYTVPYYSTTKGSIPVPNYGATSFVPVDDSQPRSFLAFTWNTADTLDGLLLTRAVGDDFQLGFFIGFPPLLSAWS